MRLDGKVAIISGGARGMGATEARMFATEGAKVVFGDVRNDLGKQVEAEIIESIGEPKRLALLLRHREYQPARRSPNLTQAQ